MPLLMVHLAVAVRIHILTGSFPSADYLLGSIAPDAIHMRVGSGDDDKHRTHLDKSDGQPYEKARAFMTQLRLSGFPAMQFVEGYVCHILTDYLWNKMLGTELYEKRIALLNHQEREYVYYAETGQIDLNLYHHAPWRPEVWSRLAVAQPKDLPSLLTADEIGKWRDRTLARFEALEQEPQIVPVHITDEEVAEFINTTAEQIQKTTT